MTVTAMPLAEQHETESLGIRAACLIATIDDHDFSEDTLNMPGGVQAAQSANRS